jgi:AGZA family xanthine/uracil permease-like MFS transporter
MRYHWARGGDVNAFFGLMLDNVAVMVTLVALLTIPGQFTAPFVLTRMIPGTALGVLLGDLVYTWMAFRLARRRGNAEVTAMPLGLDTPSTFGVAFLVLLPALDQGKRLFLLPDGQPDHERAMEFAWHVGLAVLVLIGVFKTLVSPLGNLVRRLVPRAGLLGSLSAIAIALIAFLPLLEGIAPLPVVGLLALVVILLTLVAHRRLPFNFPGALAAVLLGVAVYQLCRPFGLAPEPQGAPTGAGVEWSALFSIYTQSGDWYGAVLRTALGKLPVALPFALATIVGGIDCTESAAAAGDEYDTRAILLTEGLASLLAGLLGGVIQTTPYIGHPAYKKMGGRAAYTLATALFVGVVGCLGGFTYLFAWLPKAAMFPILVFVGLEIMAQSFQATSTRHYPALAIAVLPALAYLIMIPLKQVLAPPETLRAETLQMVQTLRCLANGFLISGLLWAAALAMILDGRLRSAAVYLAVAGVCCFFGVIHSPLAEEQMGLPWRILEDVHEGGFGRLAEALSQTTSPWDALAEIRRTLAHRQAIDFQTPYYWTAAYGLSVLLLLGLSFVRPPKDAETERPEAARMAEGLPPDQEVASAAALPASPEQDERTRLPPQFEKGP